MGRGSGGGGHGEVECDLQVAFDAENCIVDELRALSSELLTSVRVKLEEVAASPRPASSASSESSESAGPDVAAAVVAEEDPPALAKEKPARVASDSDLEASAELAEAWADAFEARWGQERAVAAGVRDAVLRARGHVEQCARVRDEMEVVAREARISLRGQSPSAW